MNFIGFIGKYSSTLDNKNRLYIPGKFVKEIKSLEIDMLIVQKGYDKCLSLYLPETFEKISTYFEPSGSDASFSEHSYFQREFWSNADYVSIDKGGRILIPKHLVQEAQLKKNILVLGVKDRIEVWNPQIYEYYREGFPKKFEEIAALLYQKSRNGFETEKSKNYIPDMGDKNV